MQPQVLRFGAMLVAVLGTLLILAMCITAYLGLIPNTLLASVFEKAFDGILAVGAGLLLVLTHQSGVASGANARNTASDPAAAPLVLTHVVPPGGPPP
jgi:hypothetical protein